LELSLGAYLAGALELVAIALSLGVGATQTRARFLPGWSGAPARLAELVIGLALLLWAMEALGAVGAMEEAPLVGLCVVLGIGVGLLASGPRGAPTRPQVPPIRRAGRVATAIACLLVVAVFAEWAGRAYSPLLYGMYGFDSLWYHMPFAARFAQEGSLTQLHFTSPALLTWFYPANSELFHTTGILLTGRDILSPFVNLAWLGATLLAAWCLGRPWGVGPAAIAGVGIVLAAGVFADQAGEARNDIPATFFLLAAAALLANAVPSRRERILAVAAAPLVLAGVAAGLAGGTKLNLLAPVAALTVGVVVAAPRGERVAASWRWIAAVLAGGGFWFVRNLAHVGNPLPWVTSVGPLSLPGPEDYLEGTREPHALIRYATDTEVWSDWLFPALDQRFGALWPAVILVGLAGAVLAVAWGRSALERVLGWTALAAFAVYPFTPLSASGPDGMPVGFASNLRYLAPVLALALALVPIGLARFGLRWRQVTLAALLLLGVVSALGSDAVVGFLSARAAAVAAIGIAILVAAAWVVQTRRPPGAAVAVGVAAVVGLAIGIGYHAQDTYLDGRYASRAGGNPEDSAFIWARHVRDSRIATVIARQYPLYGADLSNRVDFVGERGPDGSFTPVRSCEQWRQALNEGDYEYVVTGFREPTEELGTRPEEPREAAWTRDDRAAREIVRDQDVSVFRLEGPLDPAACRPETSVSPPGRLTADRH
jgi:Dolichyl-phosphate-mannose-protein mannosyltransferase